MEVVAGRWLQLSEFHHERKLFLDDSFDEHRSAVFADARKIKDNVITARRQPSHARNVRNAKRSDAATIAARFGTTHAEAPFLSSGR